MHAASRHETPSLTSWSELFWSCIWKVAHPDFDRTQPCLTSVKQVELAGPLDNSPLLVTLSIFKNNLIYVCYIHFHVLFIQVCFVYQRGNSWRGDVAIDDLFFKDLGMAHLNCSYLRQYSCSLRII